MKRGSNVLLEYLFQATANVDREKLQVQLSIKIIVSWGQEKIYYYY